MKTDYYTIRGWDIETGIPLKETLLDYGLNDIAAALAADCILPEGGPDAADEQSLVAILAAEDEARHDAPPHDAAVV